MKRCIVLCVLAACYSPSPSDCQYRCSSSQNPSDRCPAGLECDATNTWCREPGATAMCESVLCGNGKIDQDVGEQCEDGNDDTTDACVNCRTARCGDGFVKDGDETCDDGNDVDTDGCVSCRWARCGDGKVRTGVEECEDPGGLNCTVACLGCASDATFVAYSQSPDGHCYKRTSAGMTQPSAKSTCETVIPGHLLTITDETQRSLLSTNLITATSWIGLFESMQGGPKQWITGEQFGTFGSVLEDNGTELCFRQSAGAINWEDVDCSPTVERAACEVERWYVELSPAIVDNHAFRVSYAPKSWDLARQFCASIGGHLATIGADRTQVFLDGLTHIDVWIGANDSMVEGSFAWVTGEPFEFTSWANGGPGPENCVYMAGVAGQWRTANCNEARPFVCEID